MDRRRHVCDAEHEEDLIQQILDTGVLDEFYAENAPMDQQETVGVSEEFTRLEIEHLVAGLSEAYNQALANGDIAHVLLYRSLINRMLEWDDEVRETFEEAQQQPRSLSDLFGQAMGGGGMRMGDSGDWDGGPDSPL